MTETFSAENFFEIPDHLAEIFRNRLVWQIFPEAIHEYLTSHYDLRENHLAGNISEDAYLQGSGIIIEKGATIEAGALLHGPCLIGAGTEVRHAAYLRGNVITGRNCVIGHATEIKNSLLFNEAKAGHFNYVGDSILGNAVNLGAGVKLANFKLPSSSAKIKIRFGVKTKIDSGLRKLGAIIGDRSQIGCNSVTNPGTILSRDSIVYPCTTV